ncbi:hypothetical protein PAECIP111893_03554 [Paenibacillus plantiphilus]|uniref:DUF2269 domain-containing protein n=1 Tax=Paenibacillus plantiphilus TaxID=2905650 RepID=A0ABM9CFG2_9BACL|nr:DUF2269 family protein [Paenibacillus plantiphilus]CAH1212524.1 hypothetical protein PAECIP111893_03554 [Paenibacillus plantiphilus]
MPFLHGVLLYTHIVSAIMSIGPFFILIPLLSKLRASELHVQQAYLDTFRAAVRLAKHAGHVLVVSGVLLVMEASWSWTTSWIVVTVLILLSSLFFLARAFSPSIRKLAEPETDRDQAMRKLTRAVWIYLALLMIMLWFMVAKPTLW